MGIGIGDIYYYLCRVLSRVVRGGDSQYILSFQFVVQWQSEGYQFIIILVGDGEAVAGVVVGDLVGDDIVGITVYS